MHKRSLYRDMYIHICTYSNYIYIKSICTEKSRKIYTKLLTAIIHLIVALVSNGIKGLFYNILFQVTKIF